MRYLREGCLRYRHRPLRGELYGLGSVMDQHRESFWRWMLADYNKDKARKLVAGQKYTAFHRRLVGR